MGVRLLICKRGREGEKWGRRRSWRVLVIWRRRGEVFLFPGLLSGARFIICDVVMRICFHSIGYDMCFLFFCIIVFRWRRSDCVRCDMYRWNVFLWGTNVFTDFSQRVLLLYMFTFFSLSLILLSFVLFAAQGVWKKYCKKKLNVSYWKVSLSYVTRWYLLVFYVI